MGTPQNKGYKRSWKNLLLNKRYQLRFTLFMVGVSTILMLGLGYWVLSEAADATKITRNDIENRPCKPQKDPTSTTGPTSKASQPAITPDTPAPASKPATPATATDEAPAEAPDEAPAEAPDEASDEAPAEAPDEASAEASDEAPAEAPDEATGDVAPDAEAGLEGAGADDTAEPDRPPREIEVEIGEMKLDPSVLQAEQPDAAPELTAVDLARCKKEKETQLQDLEDGYARIKLVLVAFCLLLVLGLTVFGIKMTHKVAGPLYKVTLYFEKMRKGTFDQVYPLRKGDQLVEFYEQFREAHAGLKEMEEQDIAVLGELLQAADEANLKERSPELEGLVQELRELLERKKNSLS